MESKRFDDLARALVTTPSRRGVLVGVASGLSGILPNACERGEAAARKKHKRKNKKKIKRNAFGCVNVGSHCKKGEQCCSGICQGKKGKKTCKAHDQSTCQPGQSVCVEGVPTCGTADTGLCFQTTGQASFCGQTANCLDCQTDAQCQDQFGPGAACVACAFCQNIRNTGCSAVAA